MSECSFPTGAPTARYVGYKDGRRGMPQPTWYADDALKHMKQAYVVGYWQGFMDRKDPGRKVQNVYYGTGQP